MGRKPSNRSEVERQRMKVESRKRHQHSLRRAMAISDYLLLTATDMHRQATEFVNQLEEKYPGKRDVRKTPEFRCWQQQQLLGNNKQARAADQTLAQVSENSKKEMVLRIPLLQPSTNAKETPSVPETPDPISSIFEIPDDVMDKMVAEIRAVPQLDAIMNDFVFNDEVLEEGTVPEYIHQELDVGINIEIEDDRLEEEINRLSLYF